ncbi:hypothetical protein Thi970DRAFT_01145 [Thiorhodovibrio frisius]|uniref:D-glucuronyl C5-epimerase n=2 Tax=Thiorhodovibrio frisius TaxID=631362 RepID=H8YYE8_9GAMM|nr:hypothetical protein Thi970DRAFT_01145 [Thiorhodovibrio frisius]WPL23439.1 hypothetical protein Thiofri_03624 [Thiorhodovibrio frisius]
MPHYQPSDGDRDLLRNLVANIRQAGEFSSLADVDSLFASSNFPKRYRQLTLVLYAPGHSRILVSRSATNIGPPLFSNVFSRLLNHPRLPLLADSEFRLQIDFTIKPPRPVDIYRVGMAQSGDRHFEIGLDGLLFKDNQGKAQIFLPGDAYVRSIMGMGQLRDYLRLSHSEEHLRRTKFLRFRTESYVSCHSGEHWLRLYRGYPLVGPLTKDKVEHALQLAIKHIKHTQQPDGRFLYYYDAARDSRRDHEHPKRDPDKNPFYNILRHAGGGLTCIYHEKANKTGDTLPNIVRALDYLVASTRFAEYEGKTGAFIFSEKKAKLGGTGIALYLASEYQLLTGDTRYQGWIHQLAWHLLHQITETGEFIYYNIYLDRPVTPADNHQYFSFYYPGEAVCGLAKYLHLAAPKDREPFFSGLRKALHYLLVIRPRERAEEYTAVPSDSWLMMGIMELWDFPQMRNASYAEFVFADARKMVDRLYTVKDAPYPDYAGAFYYQFGDYPYSDGARCEGLLGAYELAVKIGEDALARHLWIAIQLAAWSVMHLVNTEDAIYSAPNPSLALGGIRFKYTRQWFRIDTIQHVACFYAKLLPHWPN